jgi:hypothetical protein
MTTDWIDDIETPETSVTLCLKGKLVAEHERLSAQLDGMTADPTNLAGDSPGRDIADRLVQLRGEMLEHERAFSFRAVTPRGAWRALRGKQPIRTEGVDEDVHGEEFHAWLCDIVAASSLDPAMTSEQVLRLADRLSNGQWSKLSNAAWAVNEDSQGIPFSAAASALSRSSGEKSKQPEQSTNPARGSLAGNPSSDTTTTTQDG